MDIARARSVSVGDPEPSVTSAAALLASRRPLMPERTLVIRRSSAEVVTGSVPQVTSPSMGSAASREHRPQNSQPRVARRKSAACQESVFLRTQALSSWATRTIASAGDST